MNKYLLVLTACVDPSAGTYKLAIADPKERLAEYRQSLRWWICNGDPRLSRILFIENSGWPLGPDFQQERSMATAHDRHLEFVSLNCNSYPANGHYGYAEVKMIDFGLKASRLRQCTDHIVKVTGRLQFPKLGKLLDRCQDDFDVVADGRGWRDLFHKHDKPYLSTQLILFSHRFYAAYLQESWKEMGTGHMEGLFYDKVLPFANQKKPRVSMRFPVNVEPVGIAAHSGKSYTTTRRLLANAVRGVSRKVCPNLWL